jgi:type II secretory pathway pseudopilin PulG
LITPPSVPPQDRGAALIEVVVAIAVIAVTAAALATTATAILTQSRLAATSTATREIALQIAERDSAMGCGLLSGAEPDELLRLAAARCDPLPEGNPLVLGDTDREVTRNNVDYRATVRYQWLPDPDQSGPLTCAALAIGEPAAISREVRVAPVGADTEATTHRIWQVESVPPDAAHFVSGQGALLITGLTAGEAVDIRRVTTPETTVALRRYGITIAGSTCAWFAYLTPGEYLLGRSSDTGASLVAVEAGDTTIIDTSELTPP